MLNFVNNTLVVIIMKKRNIVRLVSFLSAAVVVLAGFIIKEKQNSRFLMLQIENNYSRSMSELSASLNNITLILKKARYATAPEALSRYAAELLTEAEISKSALSQLPLNNTLKTFNRFLSQVGNYAFAVSGKLYSGEEVPKDYMENITTLCETAKKVANIVNTAAVSYDNLDYWASEIENKIDSTVDDSLSAFLEKTEGEFVDYPTLVYDGPYSDHLLESESAMLEDAAPISEDEAKTIACQFSGCEDRELELISEEKGKIESFRFGNGKTNITVSKNGGFVVYMRKETATKEHIITYKQALLKAKRFLQQNGLESFIETYYFTDEGVCVINFAYLDGQTICYTDLIKVGVAMDSGEIVLYEAAGFISNHKPRAFETATTTEKQAAEKLSHELKIIKTSIALIPTKSGGEARCYEFLCTDGETEVLVYINLLNLRQEEVLILLKGDGGTLAK